MRVLSIISVALALAASANAAVLSERAISSNVQQCINDITAAEGLLDVVKTNVDSFTSAAGYAGALAVHTKEQALETGLTAASTSCCKQKTAVTDEEGDAVMALVANLVPKIEGTLKSLVAKKDAFSGILLAANIVKTDIKNLDAKTLVLDTCLVNAAPAKYAATAASYVAKVNAAFASAKTAYGV